MIKKLLVLMAFSSCFAGSFDSLSSVASAGQCVNSCDAGQVIAALDVSSAKAKSLSTNACKVACSDQCFSGQINNKVKSEEAATTCKSSLKNTFKLSSNS